MSGGQWGVVSWTLIRDMGAKFMSNRPVRLDRYWCEFGIVSGIWYIYDRDNGNKVEATFLRKEDAVKNTEHLNKKDKESRNES